MNDTTDNQATALPVQTVALQDETEAALANMDKPLAKLLRSIRLRMQGLPVESDQEPKQQAQVQTEAQVQEREMETPPALAVAPETLKYPESESKG